MYRGSLDAASPRSGAAHRAAALRVLLSCCIAAAVFSPALAEGRRTSIGSGADAIPVVIVSGTPYEMGQSYGSLMASEINACLGGYLAVAQGYDPARYSNANLDAAWAAVEPYVKTRFIEEMQGVAAGAGVSYDLVRRAHAVSLVSDYACSDIAVWGAASANDHLYQIRNLDYVKEAGLQGYPAIIVYIPQSGVPHANVAFAGLVGSMAGMNAEGVALSEKGETPASDYPFNLDGVPFIVMFRDILQDCHSLDQALALVTSARRIKKYYYVIGDGQQPAAVKLRAFAPNLDVWTDNDPTDETYPNVRPNVVYKTMDDAAAWTHINANYGSYDADRMIDLSRLVHSEGGNLMNVVYDATAREMWIAYAEGSQDAADRPYVHFSLNDYIPAQTVGGYGFYETIGAGEDAITVLHVGGTHYQMGYWHGRLLRDQVRANSASAIAAAEAGGVNSDVWAWAIASMWPYVPRDYLDEMQGLADGSGLAVEDVYKMHAIPDLSEYHCSAFAAMGAATVGGHDIQLRNLDWGLEFGIQQHPLLIVYEPDDANKYVDVSFAGFLGVIAGMSYKQIPVSEMGDSFDYDNETLEGEPMPFLLKDVLEHAQSYTEAESIVRNAHRTSSLWYTASDPNEGKAGLMMTSPTIFQAYHLGDMPGGILPAIPDVIYGGQYNDRLYADLTANWGKIDLDVGKAISINNAMNSNLMNAVYDATDLKMYVAYAEGQDRAANRDYIFFDFNWPTQPVAAATASPATAYIGQTINFSAAASSHPNPNHHIVAYDWDWNGDGTYDASGVTATHAFAAAGTYNVTLRVTDDFIPGQAATTTVTATVTDRPVITKFAINDGTTLTTSLAVKLSLECVGVNRMRFRNDGGAWSAWMPYASSADWTLAGGAEGWRRVDAQCVTADGYGTYAVKALIFYDKSASPPSGTAVINGGAQYTDSLHVTLMLYGKGATGVRLKSRYTDPWGLWQAYSALAQEPYGQTMPWTLLAGGEGQRGVYVQYRDSYGNTSAPRCAVIIYDTSAPPTLTMTINRGAAYTSSAAVTLRFDLKGTVAKEMRFRNSEADPWGEWTPFDWTRAWTLAAGADGPRTVYAQARDYLGNESATASASIGLDGPAPPVGSIQINGGAVMTLFLDVTVNNRVSGAAKMRFKQAYADQWGAWMPFAASLPLTLRSGADSLREVYAQFVDGVGNLSAVMCATITYETFAPPALVYFRIGDSEQTASLDVTLNVAATDAAEMRFKNSGAAAWSAWRPYANSTAWTLEDGSDGPRTVYAQCRDYLGEVSNIKSDSITLAR